MPVIQRALLMVFVLSLGSCVSVPPEGTFAPSSQTAQLSPDPTQSPTATAIPATPTLAPETAFIKGITLNYGGVAPKLDSPDSQQVIQQIIIPSGANYVTLAPTCWSTTMADTSIVCSDERLEGGVPPVSDEELINTIRYLHGAGLRVILKPQALIQSVHIAEQEPKERHWGEAQRKAWFDSYIAFITHYAQIARDNQVDLFVVGNEQEDNIKHEQDWRRVIAEVRDVYHGPITYAANAWEFEASRIKFWDALDYIGTNAYQFGFLDKKDPSIDDRIKAWQPYIQRLEEMSEEYGKQVIITEIGALAMAGFHTGITNPPHWAPQPYDGQGQADFYTAFFEALKDKPWLKGVILWDVYTNVLQGGHFDISYTFVGKPAEHVVRRYFGGEPIAPSLAPDLVEEPENSMWIYRDELMNSWYPWDDPAAITTPDLLSMNGHDSSHSIRVALSKSQGLWLNYGTPGIDLSRYKWLQFYIMVGERQPKSLLLTFENWDDSGANSGSRMVPVDSPAYIDGGQYSPGTWQRVRIPLSDLGFTNEIINGLAVDILSCAWPCRTDPSADDIYIDDLQLVAGRLPGTVSPTSIPELVEDPANSMRVYQEGLSAGWRPWYEPDALSTPVFDSPNGHDSNFSIQLDLSQYKGLWLIHDAPKLDLSRYKWLEFYIMVGEHPPGEFWVVFEDWINGVGTNSSLGYIRDPRYLQGGQYVPNTWQRVRIPLADLGLIDQESTGFNILSCPDPCSFDPEVDYVYIDDISLVAGKSP